MSTEAKTKNKTSEKLETRTKNMALYFFLFEMQAFLITSSEEQCDIPPKDPNHNNDKNIQMCSK